MKTVARAALIAVPFVSMLTACGGGGDGGSGSGGTTGNGTLQVSMTDALLWLRPCFCHGQQGPGEHQQFRR
jgi:hypothetical protein